MDYDEYQEQRELLNQVRPKGRGSRGRRKPRKDWKPHTRKQSQREAARSEDVVRAVIKLTVAKRSARQRAETSKLLSEKYDLDVTKLSHPPALLNAVLGSPNRLLVIKANKRYLNAIIYAYSLYEWITSAEEWAIRMFILLVSEHTKIPLTPKFNLLRAVMRLAIDYEEDDRKSDNSGKWSRDALAVEWLMKTGVRPNGVVAYQKEFGGGVNDWSRLMSRGAAGRQQNKLTAEVCALQIERVAKARNATKQAEADYYDDNGSAPGLTKRGEKDLEARDRTTMRLQKPAGGTAWHKPMSLYHARDQGIAPSELMITFVVGDDGPLGCHSVGTASAGPVPSSRPERVTEALREAVKAARSTLNRFTPKGTRVWRGVRKKPPSPH